MSEIKNWDEFLELIEEYSNQYGAYANKQKPELPPEPKPEKRPAYIRDWSESSTSEIIDQLPNSNGAVIKGFYVRIWKECDNTYNFNIYEVINKLHRHVKVATDPRFKNESWSKYFLPKASRLSLKEAITIVVYLQDIQDLLILV